MSGQRRFDRLSGGDAVGARHPQIHQHLARLELGCQSLGFRAVAGLADDAHIAMALEQRAYALAHRAAGHRPAA